MKEYNLKINGRPYSVTINSIKGGHADVCVNGKSYDVEIDEDAAVPAQQAEEAVSTTPNISSAAPASVSGSGKKVTSPLPGVIIDICVKEGQAVKSGQKVAVLEAMKMENEILAEYDGTVKSVHVSKGDSILEGAEIVTIE